MTVPIALLQTIVIRDQTYADRYAEYGAVNDQADVAVASAGLAVAAYCAPVTGLDAEWRLRAFDPVTGATHFDEAYLAGALGRPRLVRYDDDTVVLFHALADSSGDTDTCHVGRVTVAGASFASVSATGLPAGAPSVLGEHAYLALVASSTRCLRAHVPTLALEEFVTDEVGPPNITNTFQNAFRDAVAQMGTGLTANSGTSGSVYLWRHGDVAFAEHPSGLSVPLHPSVASSGQIYSVAGPISSTYYHSLLSYDVAGDAFTGIVDPFRLHVDADFEEAGTTAALWQRRLEETAGLLLEGYAVEDQSHADTGQVAQFGVRVYAASQAGDYGWLDHRQATLYPPDPVDGLSYTDVQLPWVAAYNGRWAALVAFGEALYDPGLDVTAYHSVLALLTGVVGVQPGLAGELVGTRVGLEP